MLQKNTYLFCMTEGCFAWTIKNTGTVSGKIRVITAKPGAAAGKPGNNAERPMTVSTTASNMIPCMTTLWKGRS